MSEPMTATSSGWKVTGQRETKELPAGAQNYVDGVTVTFLTGHQVTGSVFVAYPLTPDRVKAAIDARAAQLDAVSSLTSD